MAAPRLTLAVLVLMLAVIAVTEAMRGAGPKKCCSSFNDKPVRRDRVVSYTRTSQRCPVPAVRLTTITGRQLCVKSSHAWVKELISKMDNEAVPGETSHL